MNEHLKLCDPFDIMDQAAKDIMRPPVGVTIDGWDTFNEFSGGLRPHEFTIFCGGTGIGKTQFLAALTAGLISKGVKTFVAPVETGAVDLMRRIFSVFGGYDFNAGVVANETMLVNLKNVMKNHSGPIADNLKIAIYDNRVDVDEMIMNLKYMSEVLGVKVALLDNLNFFMKPTRPSETILETDQVIHNFVMLAKKLPIHIVLVMHPKKTEGGKVVSEFDIKGSSTAVQEASNVLLMNRLNDNEITGDLTPFHRELVFRKIRRRGFYVGRKFYMRYEHGKYVDANGSRTGKANVPKTIGPSKIKGTRPDTFLGNND